MERKQAVGIVLVNKVLKRSLMSDWVPIMKHTMWTYRCCKCRIYVYLVNTPAIKRADEESGPG